MILTKPLRESINLTPLGENIWEKMFRVDEETKEQSYWRTCLHYADDRAHAERLYRYVQRHWFMFSTPLLSNGGTSRGLPISCFLNTVEDSTEGILKTYDENAHLSRIGGGLGTDWSQVRSFGSSTSVGNISSGIIPFIKVLDSISLAFDQGATRRGSTAVFLDVSHPEIEEFLDMRKPSGGDFNRKALNLHAGVNISDEFMKAVKYDFPFNLTDPNSKEITKTVSARMLWQKLLATRQATGEPYLIFLDKANELMNPYLKEQGKKIRQSNLCTEIFLPTEPDYTAVCCLSSLNLAKFTEWQGEAESFIEDLIRMLDNALEKFAEAENPALRHARASVLNERSIGLGTMGWHSFLQQIEIPFESASAIAWTNKIFKTIRQNAVKASKVLAKERGEPEGIKGSGMRNAHLLAIAPNATSSNMCGEVSPGVEPFSSNYYTKKTKAGTSFFKNPNLFKYIPEDDTETWKSILNHEGSVQHLDHLDPKIKEVFKTAYEINQDWIVEQAQHRQNWLCQGQSINLFFEEDADPSVINQVHFNAWAKGLKSVYYYRNKSLRRAENISVEQKRNLKEELEFNNDECIACES
tara:strand:+ start:3408 stop:5156 length:1749 start_codon:yes stop_codon:yes gene_type:complete